MALIDKTSFREQFNMPYGQYRGWDQMNTPMDTTLNAGNVGISMNQNYVPRVQDPNRFLPSGIGSFYNQRPLNTLDPNWQNELAGYGSTMDRGNIDRGFLSGITGPVMGGLKWLGEKFQRPEAKQRFYDEVMQGRSVQPWTGDQRPGRPTDTTVTGTTLPGTGGQRPAYTGPKTYSYDPGLARAMGGQRAPTTGGFTNPGKDSYGPHRAEGGRMAYGGRAGYQDGELVEDESMFAATPRGMMEENIEEVQGEPTREQLEAIALEIFRLPLEELNEEQLNVVYQAAMEQEPAEEEVQFAAQEGPAEGIASLV
jgi:hypothetical protein